MDSFEWNKIFAAVISGALLIMVISTVSGGLFPEYDGGTSGFPVEVAEASTGGVAAIEEGPSLAELLASADAKKGERAFSACKSCHTADEGGRNGTGPNLYNILGRPVAGDSSFGYSSGLAGFGGNWTYETLDTWLANPKKMVAKTSMSYGGMRKAAKRADLIAYLRSLSATPQPLPEAVAAAVEDVAASN